MNKRGEISTYDTSIKNCYNNAIALDSSGMCICGIDGLRIAEVKWRGIEQVYGGYGYEHWQCRGSHGIIG
jgi:hypothetical protein